MKGHDQRFITIRAITFLCEQFLSTLQQYFLNILILMVALKRIHKNIECCLISFLTLPIDASAHSD